MRQAKNNSIMNNVQLKWTKKSFNQVAKQQIFMKKTYGLRLLYLMTKKWIFCTETTYLKILKEKYQSQASQPSHDSDYLAKLATSF